MEMLYWNLLAGRGLCVGLDSRASLIPQKFKGEDDSDPWFAVEKFNRDRIWQTQDFVCAYMADHNFYLAGGMETLRKTIQTAHCIAPKVPFILGSYGGGVRHSNDALAEYAFDYLNADAITINPWFGQEAFQPFLKRHGKGVIVTCRTSNYGATEFQDLELAKHDGVPLFKTVAHNVANYWNDNHNCGLLMGPMSYGELSKVREVADRLPIFVTGIGTQGNASVICEEDVKEIIVNGKNCEGIGVVVCSSRSVIFAAGERGPFNEAERLHRLIVKYRSEISL